MNVKDFAIRYLSRKFLLGLSGPIVALIVHLWPDTAEQAETTARLIVEVIANLAALVTPTAFIIGESKIDAARIDADASKAVAAMEKAPPAASKEVLNESLENPK